MLTVKQNQKKLHSLIHNTFEELSEDNFKHPRALTHTTREKNSGRGELRSYTVFPAPAVVRKMGWTDAHTIGMVYHERNMNGKTSQELVYFISSLPPKVRQLAKHVRNHWRVKNQLHWSLDVSFAEDTSRTRKGEGPANAAIFRRLHSRLLSEINEKKRACD